MAADILVGLLLGGLAVAILNPWRGVYFVFRDMRKQIEFLRADPREFPNRKEDS